MTIIGLETDRLASSLTAYRAAARLPVCAGCLRIHPVARSPRPPQEDTTAPATGAVGERVDSERYAMVGHGTVQAAAAICPTCRIDYVQAASRDPLDIGFAFAYAVRTLRSRLVITPYTTPSDGKAADQVLYRQFYAVRGMTHLVAAGDTGRFTNPHLPISAPTALSVGGTTVEREADGSWGSTGWHDTATGCSLAFERPAWQRNLPLDCAGRVANDLAAAADPDTWPLAVVVDTGVTETWRTTGGTAVAAALVGGWIASAGLGGLITPEWLYTHPRFLSDVTSGPATSCLVATPCVPRVDAPPCTQARFCTPGPGWDGPTGLGTMPS